MDGLWNPGVPSTKVSANEDHITYVQGKQGKNNMFGYYSSIIRVGSSWFTSIFSFICTIWKQYEYNFMS